MKRRIYHLIEGSSPIAPRADVESNDGTPITDGASHSFDPDLLFSEVLGVCRKDKEQTFAYSVPLSHTVTVDDRENGTRLYRIAYDGADGHRAHSCWHDLDQEVWHRHAT